MSVRKGAFYRSKKELAAEVAKQIGTESHLVEEVLHQLGVLDDRGPHEGGWCFVNMSPNGHVDLRLAQETRVRRRDVARRIVKPGSRYVRRYFARAIGLPASAVSRRRRGGTHRSGRPSPRSRSPIPSVGTSALLPLTT